MTTTTGPLSFADLEPALEREDVDEVVVLFTARSEAERRKVAADVWRWCTNVERSEHGTTPEMAFYWRRKVATPAVLACATKTELRKMQRWLAFGDASFQVLDDRRPEWLGPWMEALLEKNPGMWGFCHRLVLAGAIPKPKSDVYIVGMFFSYTSDGRRSRSPRDLVGEDPGLLEDEIWRFFEVEGRRRGQSLTSRGQQWSALLLELSEQGAISRDRLLNYTLDALTRDFSAYNARWFQDFHGRLSPSLEEQAARAERYLHLLGSQVSPTARLAIDVLRNLDASGRLSAPQYCEAAELAVSSGPKVVAQAAVELLERVVARDPSARSRAAGTGVTALAHQDIDVQRRALDVISHNADPGDVDVRSALLAVADSVAPSLRGRIETIIGLQISAAAAGGYGPSQGAEEALRVRAEALPAQLRRLAGIDEALGALGDRRMPPALSFARHEIPVIHPGNAVRPVEDLAELVDLLTSLVESVESADNLERALDGVSRLCDQNLDGATVAPLRKRAAAILNGSSSNRPIAFMWGDPRGDICGVVCSWIPGKTPFEVGARPGAPGPAGFLSRRAHEVAQRASKRAAQPLLAAPTHRGGWIDADTLNRRLNLLAEDGGKPSKLDFLQAALRATPPIDLVADAEAAPTLARFMEAARAGAKFSLDSDPFPGDSRRPAGDDPAAVWWYDHWREHWTFSPASVRWVATVCPWASESFFEMGARSTTRFIDMSPAPDGTAHLEVMLDPDVPIGPSGIHLLAVSLGAKDAHGRSLAVDALTAAAEVGRLDVVELAHRLNDLLDRDIVNAARLASALGEAARSSLLHSHVVHAVLVDVLAGDPGNPPRQLHHLLQLELDLSLELGFGIDAPEARAYLDQLRARSAASKQGRLAKDLLALAPEEARSGSLTALLQAVEARIDRAERWSASLAYR